MEKYSIEYNFTASIVVDVEANNEGEALEKGRIKAEDADIRQFTICGERESRILRRE